MPKTITRIGQHVLKGVATGNVQGTVTDYGGHKRQFSFDDVVVPEMGFKLFSVTTVVQKRIPVFSPWQAQVGVRRRRSSDERARDC